MGRLGALGDLGDAGYFAALGQAPTGLGAANCHCPEGTLCGKGPSSQTAWEGMPRPTAKATGSAAPQASSRCRGDRPVNILQMCSGKGPNGAAYSTLLFTRELAERGHRVWLVCRPESWLAGQFDSEPVEVIRSDMHRLPPDELRRIARLARQHEIDVISTHMSRAHLFGVLLRWMTGIPCVATAHSRRFQPHWMFNDYVIAVSEATRRYHVRYNLVRRSRIETVFNFIDPRWTGQVREDARARIRAEFGVDDSSLLIATVGWLIPRKGQIYLIRALPKILQAAPGAKLVAIGKSGVRGKYLARLRAEAERLGVADHFIWGGVRDDMEQFYFALDLLVHTALEEPMGRVLLEAMAAGVPVVSTDVTGTGECVAHGRTGLLVPPRDPEALAEATIALLGDPVRRRQFGQAAVRRVQEEFSSESQVTRAEAILRRAARRRTAA